MAKIENLDRLLASLRKRLAKSIKDDEVSVVVGFTAMYAIYVHENLEARHAIGAAKFLETPARQNVKVYADIIKEAAKQKKTLAQSLLLAGLRLQRDSQLLCPVDTGALKNSAFTRLERKGKSY